MLSSFSTCLKEPILTGKQPLLGNRCLWQGFRFCLAFLSHQVYGASGWTVHSLCLEIYWGGLIKQSRDFPAATRAFDMLNCKCSLIRTFESHLEESGNNPKVVKESQNNSSCGLVLRRNNYIFLLPSIYFPAFPLGTYKYEMRKA